MANRRIAEGGMEETWGTLMCFGFLQIPGMPRARYLEHIGMSEC